MDIWNQESGTVEETENQGSADNFKGVWGPEQIVNYKVVWMDKGEAKKDEHGNFKNPEGKYNYFANYALYCWDDAGNKRSIFMRIPIHPELNWLGMRWLKEWGIVPKEDKKFLWSQLLDDRILGKVGRLQLEVDAGDKSKGYDPKNKIKWPTNKAINTVEVFCENIDDHMGREPAAPETETDYEDEPPF